MVQAIVQSRKHVSLLSLACIASALVIIDGPLLQRASTVARVEQTRNVTVELQMAEELVSGFSG